MNPRRIKDESPRSRNVRCDWGAFSQLFHAASKDESSDCNIYSEALGENMFLYFIDVQKLLGSSLRSAAAEVLASLCDQELSVFFIRRSWKVKVRHHDQMVTSFSRNNLAPRATNLQVKPLSMFDIETCLRSSPYRYYCVFGGRYPNIVEI